MMVIILFLIIGTYLGGPSSLILHNSEWNRLKKQSCPPKKPSQQENEYLKTLIEKSQSWIKTWPDTVQGCVALIEKQKEKHRAEEIAAVKAYAKRKVKKNNAEAIQNAKQTIFDESCYGQKLLCALRESKTLEERNAQIELAKEIKQKEAELEKKRRKTVTFCTFDLDKNSEALEEQQKCLTIQNAKENKEIYEKQKEEEAKAKEEKIQSDLTDTQLMKYLLEREQEAEDKVKLLEKQALDQCAAEYRKTKEERAKWEEEYYAKIEKCRQEQEELNCKIQQVHSRMNKGTQDSEINKINYETVKKCQEEEKKRYDTFIEKSNKKGEERAAKRERRANDKKIQDRNRTVSTAELNKKLAEYIRLSQCDNKCFCDRQSLITKSSGKQNLKKGKGDIEPETKEVPRRPYFGPCNKLMAALRRREKEPAPWTGAGTAHELFTKNATKILRDCKYKNPARKVIDEYRKYNGLDEKTLPIPNY